MPVTNEAASELSQTTASAISSGRSEMFGVPRPLGPVLEIIDSYVSGAVLALIGWWLDDDQPYSVEQMAKVADDLSLSAMTRLERVTEIASGLPSVTTANG